MSKLTRGDVLKLARLARLELTEAEIKEYQTELSQILSYVEQLQQADTKGLDPTNQVTGLINVWRNDEVKNYGYDQAKLLKNVPKVKDGQILVRRMVN